MKLSSQRCVAPWDELLGDDDKEAHSGEDSEDQGKPPIRAVDMPLYQGHLWEHCSQKQKPQAQSLLKSSNLLSLPVTSSSWCQPVRTDTISKNISSFGSSGAPWLSSRKHAKTRSYIARRMNPINDFWARPEACYEALKRMVTAVGREPQIPTDDEPETSFWSEFQASPTSSPKSPTPSRVLSSVKEQNEEDKDYINDCGFNNMLVALPPTLTSPSQQYQLNDQDYVNVFVTDDILGTMQEISGPATVYENRVGTELAQEYQITSQEDTHTVDLKKDNEEDLVKFSDSPDPRVSSNVQEQVAEESKLMGGNQEEKVVVIMNDRVKGEKSGVYDMQEQGLNSILDKKQAQQDVGCSNQEPGVDMMYESPCIRMKQYNPQLTTFKKPMDIIVKLSDIIQASPQPKLKLADLIKQPSPPVKHQTSHLPPSAPSHLSRPRLTLADLMY
ncbi:hypothetical protein MAM1_0429d10467 [Mucor ambiguus]|uniref:Uncharacterized protein n=1 Tax=Mucor ambiguus TaxID=91626 RepID=A0A0C9N4C4_9FUNG|nr:hypothetical protein MAM1_0228c08377 [Mucor ambiguus]GAN10917.1 hypothetical protein MAM1_0429d10467 [Mucor ambiguus]